MLRLRRWLAARLRDERGFTLVELMMVMVIIGTLAGLGFTGYNALQARAAKTQADVYWRDLNMAVTMYRMTGGEFSNLDDEEVVKDDLSEFLDTGVPPWSTATLVTDLTQTPSDPLAFAIQKDSDGRYFVCVWVNGHGSNQNPSDCYPTKTSN